MYCNGFVNISITVLRAEPRILGRRHEVALQEQWIVMDVPSIDPAISLPRRWGAVNGGTSSTCAHRMAPVGIAPDAPGRNRARTLDVPAVGCAARSSGPVAVRRYRDDPALR